ncbi:hypothetical protein QE152_g26556 [Popillia japonica]|uniref:HAT C-terminal dimerisation domain-containing protein n=1 Tax=Popillia japonica TaxID=7064 RepID=A0AAW1JWF4_POPJA
MLSVPSSSASVEREFFRQSRIHTKDKNKCSNETVEKSLGAEHNLRFLEAENESNNSTYTLISQIPMDGPELKNSTLEEMAVDILSVCSFIEIDNDNEVTALSNNSDMDMEKQHKQHENLQDEVQEVKSKEDENEMPLSVLAAPSSRRFYGQYKLTENINLSFPIFSMCLVTFMF